MSLKTTCSDIDFYRSIAYNDNTNPNTNDFSKEKFGRHIKYIIVLDDGDPICMGGLKELKTYLDVGRLMDRFYIFPEYRNKINYTAQITYEYIIKPLVDISPFNTHVVTMANRGERNNHFNAFEKYHHLTWPNHWHRVDGYIQTSNSMKRRSWQNALTDNPNYPFKVLNHDQWLVLP